MSKIYFGGSRSLNPQQIPLVSAVVSAVLASGSGVAVGCASGADQAVISSIRPSSFPQVSVYAAFAASGAGSVSAVSAVSAVQSFAAAGGSVVWLAGGALSVPVRARLWLRSMAALSGCSSAVFFTPGAGSLAVAGAAVSRGALVFAFAASAPGSPRGCAGAWVSASLFGFACWAWLPSAVQSSLF